MKIDTSKLVDALSKVVDLAHREANARAEVDALNEAIAASQADIDAIAIQLIEAAGSKAAATGLAAVATALTAPILYDVVAPDEAPEAPVVKTTVLPAVDFAPAPKADLAAMDDILANLR
jgi:hypothetical protein